MTGNWQTCRIGSCHRHEECMYHPCRNHDPAPPMRPAGWRGIGCYVSPYPAQISERYDYTTGDYVMVRQHIFQQANGIPAKCNPAACRECERERTWHDHGEPK